MSERLCVQLPDELMSWLRDKRATGLNVSCLVRGLLQKEYDRDSLRAQGVYTDSRGADEAAEMLGIDMDDEEQDDEEQDDGNKDVSSAPTQRPFRRM